MNEHEPLPLDTSSLRSELQPRRDLWPSVLAQVESPAEPEPSTSWGYRLRTVLRPWVAVAGLSAAGLALVLTQAGPAADLPPASEPVAAGSENAGLEAAVDRPENHRPVADADVELKKALDQYAEASRRLQDAFELRKGKLAPDTRAVLEDNLAIVDEAIFNIDSALVETGEPSLLPLAVEAHARRITLLQSALVVIDRPAS